MNACIACKIQVGEVEFKPSSNFMSHDLLAAGNMMCKLCHHIITSRESRTTNWLMEGIEQLHFKRDRAYEILLRHKVPPFVLYFTQTFKTQGFIQLLSRRNLSNEEYCIGFDRDLIWVRQTQIIYLIDLIHRARELGFGKRELVEGPYIKHYEHRTLCNEINSARNEQVWPLLVWADTTDLKKKEEPQQA